MAATARGLHADERGTVTVFVVGVTVAMLVVAGLVYDGGRVLAGRREAHHVADNAARAGAQAVDLQALRAGVLAPIDAAAAELAARAYLDRAGHNGTVSATPEQMHVVVTIDVPLRLLGLVGLQARTVTGTGTATLVGGVTGPE